MPTESVKTNPAVFGAGARLLRGRHSKGSNTTGISGVDLMRKINEGVVQQVSSVAIDEIRNEISRNCEEIIDQGARVRPLLADTKQIGWVRGLHMTERR